VKLFVPCLCANDYLPIIRVMYGALELTKLLLGPMRVMHLPSGNKENSHSSILSK
jgi:hypothetical protein